MGVCKTEWPKKGRWASLPSAYTPLWAMASFYILHTHTHTYHLTALFPGLPGWAGTRKVKPIWILLKQETVSGSGISWAICKSAPRSREITTPTPHRSVFFTGRMPFLPPNQQRQSIIKILLHKSSIQNMTRLHITLFNSSPVKWTEVLMMRQEMRCKWR